MAPCRLNLPNGDLHGDTGIAEIPVQGIRDSAPPWEKVLAALAAGELQFDFRPRQFPFA